MDWALQTGLSITVLIGIIMIVRRPFARTFGAGAAYALWLYRRVVMGDLIKEGLKSITDMDGREKAIFVPLIVMTLLLGVYPSLVTDIIGPSVAALVGQYDTATAAFEAANQIASN